MHEVAKQSLVLRQKQDENKRLAEEVKKIKKENSRLEK
jgi:cell division protein FtsB